MSVDLKTYWNDFNDYGWFTQAKFNSLSDQDAYFNVAKHVYEIYMHHGTIEAQKYVDMIPDLPKYMQMFLQTALHPRKSTYGFDITAETVLAALRVKYYGNNVTNVHRDAMGIEGSMCMLDGSSNSWVFNYITSKVRRTFEEKTGIDAYVLYEHEGITINFKTGESLYIDNGLGVLATKGIDSGTIVRALEAVLEVTWNERLDQALYTRRRELAGNARSKEEMRKFLEIREYSDFTVRDVTVGRVSKLKLSAIKLEDLGEAKRDGLNKQFRVLRPYIETTPKVKQSLTARALLFVRVFGQELV